MNPALLLVLTFGAGLATGLLRFWAPAVLILPGLAALYWRGRRLAVWVLAFLLGAASALLVRAAESRSCAARMPTAQLALVIRVREPVLPEGGIGRVRPLAGGCQGEIDARWPRGMHLEAGSRARVAGRWVPRPDSTPRAQGLLLVSRVELLDMDPSATERLRNWVATTVRALYGARAGTVEALVINRRGGMAPELRDRYARSGLVHILSISGFHVGVLVGWVILVGRLLGTSRARAALAATVLAVAYVLFLGWPPPAARAALLVAMSAQFHLRQRNPQAIPLLAVTALLVVLLDPWASLDPGAWLSVAALGGAVVATRWSDQALGTGWWWRTLSGSIGATLATAPITAALFGMVSLAGLVLNFVAIPLAALAVPGVLLSLLLAACSPALAAPLAAGAGALLGLLDQVAWWGGRWDAGVVVQAVEPGSALPWLVVLVLAGWSIGGGTWRWEALRRASLGIAAGVWLLVGLETYDAVHDAGSGLSLHFLDVGQGDAAAIRTPAGHWVLVDAGPRTERNDAGRRVVAPFLARHHAAALTVALLSHAHADHLGGLPAVLDRYPAARVLEPAELVPDPLYAEFLTRLEEADVPWQAARAGQSFVLDSVRFTLVHPDTAWAEWGLDLNEDSAVLLVEYRGFRALLDGDAGLHAEAHLAGRIGGVDLLKVGHHGSRSASGEPWLAELAPRAAVISVGRGNRYGHPHAEVLERLVRHGMSVWRTDLQGTITVTTDGRSFTIEGRGRHETIATRGLPRAAQ